MRIGVRVVSISDRIVQLGYYGNSSRINALYVNHVCTKKEISCMAACSSSHVLPAPVLDDEVSSSNEPVISLAPAVETHVAVRHHYLHKALWLSEVVEGCNDDLVPLL